MRAPRHQPQANEPDHHNEHTQNEPEAVIPQTAPGSPGSRINVRPHVPTSITYLQHIKGNAFTSQQLQRMQMRTGLAAAPQTATSIPGLVVSRTVQRKEENKEPLANIQGLPMYDLLPRLEALPAEVRTDEEAGQAVGGPRLVVAMRAVRTKSDRDLVNFLSINKPELDRLPPDQFTQIFSYLGAPAPNAAPAPAANTARSVAQLSTSEKFTVAVQQAITKLPGELGERLKELLKPESIAMMISFTALYIASQATPAGWVADGIGIALILASAIMIGPEVVTIVEHLVSFAQKASNATSDQDIDSAADDLAFAVTKLGVDVVMAILLHKAGKSGSNAVKAYVKPTPGLTDVVTADGRIVRAPVEEVNTYERRGSGDRGGKVSTADAIRALGDDFIDQCEARDGHLIREHVSRTNQELVRRANQEQVDATTFQNKSGAIAAVRYNLRTNAAEVAAWLEDASAPNRLVTNADHPMAIGRGVKAGARTVQYDLGTSRLVLVKDATMPLKFRVLTGFPVLQP